MHLTNSDKKDFSKKFKYFSTIHVKIFFQFIFQSKKKKKPNFQGR